ncbi:16S rRNA (adenine(1518)-N(6)/adenine(1519)-N(6))-dimethyltransferase RsmA [Pigmentibacter sp. JX0631]|uniref:16S rRNA (adenine(1518)-N(6)/adenine(1519)-N(6))- dimethyltransferase RsmA n=1 Tax=Pigmentibacter sp. JX0631 TaxID=2976982 RepID=UPI002468D7C6|nr:16S rRNA (adenine(1518)-N(6)/adenine(1519)-N(6))-dimethyltransferase RsmA [Pigmentibacter sp. JX0631]WGL61015.1 16S rRNA (adenine(1518)-N(6)/adenine(1519)-N(6))-dimethyltransferase RsmA [Pigmentibacter sp. JX0631]
MKNKTNQEKNNQAFYLQAKKSLGQNFLNSEAIIDKISQSIDVLYDAGREKYLHEIGPGSGALTKKLLEKNIKILAIEKDQRAVEGLMKTLVLDYPDKLNILNQDILQWNPIQDNNISSSTKPICVGNIPYYITSDILMWFCKFKKLYSNGIFMVQKEVADRLNAKPGTKDYGRLTVKVQLFFKVEKLFDVPAHLFVPKPKVDSAIIKLTPNLFSFADDQEDTSFGKFTTVLFSARRKMLRRALALQLQTLQQKNPKKVEEFWQLASEHNITEESRPDTISPIVILAFYKFFQDAGKNL